MGKTFLILLSVVFLSCNDDKKEIKLTKYEDYEKKYFILEGGLSKDKTDNASKGSPKIHTNKGLTWKVYKKYCKKILGEKPNKNTFINLDNEEVSLFIRELYWEMMMADSIKDQMKANLLVDTYVNMGNTAFILLKKTIKEDLDIDIKINYNKLNKEIIDRVNEDDNFYETYKKLRINKYHSISKGKNKKFIKGWLNRIKKLES